VWTELQIRLSSGMKAAIQGLHVPYDSNEMIQRG
jgi:hypothetical protein